MLPLIIKFVYFLLIITFLAFSGNLILRSFKLNLKSSLENFIFSLTLPLVLLTLISFAVLVLNFPFLVGPIFWLFLISGVLNIIYLIPKKKIITKINFDWWLFCLTLILTLIMVSVTFRSGWKVKDGLEFFGVNAHDGLWHLSLIGELKNHFPPQHPNFSGIELRGYHYLLDLLLAKFSLSFGFNETDLYFRFFPFLTAVLWCLATFLLAQRYFNNKYTSFLTVILSILGGSFAYFLSFFSNKAVNLDSDFGVSSPVSSLINLQFSFSIPILALTLFAFHEYLRVKKTGWGLIVAIFTGALFGIKIYAGIIALFAVCSAAFIYIIESSVRRACRLAGRPIGRSIIRTKNLQVLWVAILAGLFAIFVYLPTRAAGAGLVYAPGEMIQNVIRGPLSWTLWELQRQVYAEHHNWRGLARLRILAFLVFLFGNLGTKILGLGEILRFKKSSVLTKDFGLFFFVLILPFLIPIFFIQSMTPFNIVQFWWYFVYFMSFLSAAFLWRFIKYKNIYFQIITSAIVLILTVPAAFFVAYGYLFPKSSYLIPNWQLTALKFLKEKTNPDDVILEIPANYQKGFNFNLPFIPAVSQRRVFLGQEMVEFSYLDKKSREENLGKIIAPMNCGTLDTRLQESCRGPVGLSYETLHKNSINYIVSPLALFWFEENSKISSLIYSRDGVYIYKIK